MEALQKFKLLATQCAVMGENPTRSPRTTPLINIRRRITLSMLLSRTGNGGGSRRLSQRQEKASPDRRRRTDKGNESVDVRQQLRDLFVLTESPPDFDDKKVSGGNVREGVFVAAGLAGSSGGGFGLKRNGGVKSPTMRPVSATIRQRLLRRRNWKPVLVTIPE